MPSVKTSVSLTILGVYNTLMGVALTGRYGRPSLAKPTRPTLSTGNGHHVPLRHRTCHLHVPPRLLLIRKSALDTTENALLAYCISTALLLTLFATVFSNTPVMEFSLEMAVPDILALGVALFGYFKAK